MKYATTAISLLLTALPCTAADFFLKNGDRVVMMGDSITEQHLYSTYVEVWALTPFPSWDLKFFNVGIGGDNATGGGERFKRDVVSCEATAMTVNFGMNDCGDSSAASATAHTHRIAVIRALRLPSTYPAMRAGRK